MNIKHRSLGEWFSRCKPAIFRAERGPGIRSHQPSVIVYPLKDGSGYLWLIWHGFDWDDIDRSIKQGGFSKRPLRRVILLAVEKLMAYKGRPTIGRKKR